MPGDFNFKNLTPEVRGHILAEINLDVENGVLYFSDRFNGTGRTQYLGLIRAAAQAHDEVWLAEQLLNIAAFNAKEFKAGIEKDVPRNAHTVFAQGEFNRFYIRGVCCYAIEHPAYGIRIYRARESSKPRPESEAKIGKMLVAGTLLQDLRTRIATNAEFGMPEINSGLSVELVADAAAS